MSEGFVYIIHAVGTNRVKIGYSIEPGRRLGDLQVASPFPLELIGVRPGTPEMEKALHRRLEQYHCVGEWFEIDPDQALSIVRDFNHESAATALAHLEAIYRVAAGQGSAKRDVLDKRKAAVVAFVLTGQCVAEDPHRELAAKLTEIVTSHLAAADAA